MKIRYYFIALWWCAFAPKKARKFYELSKEGMHDLFAYKQAKDS